MLKHYLLILNMILSIYFSTAHARLFRVDQIPHGPQFRCLNCHFTQQGGSVNAFGYDVLLSLQNTNVDWNAVCELDSDQDGLTNGEELGDPNCNWTGMNTNGYVATNPGDANSPLPVLPDMDIVDQMVIDMAVDMEMIPDRDLWDAWLHDLTVEDSFITNPVAEDLAGIDMRMVDLSLNTDMMVEIDMHQDMNDVTMLDMTQVDLDIPTLQDQSLASDTPVMSSSSNRSKSSDASGCHSHSHSTAYTSVLLCFILAVISIRKQRISML